MPAVKWNKIIARLAEANDLTIIKEADLPGFNTAGDLASWEEILPATNGTFSVQCTRWMRAYLSEPQSLKSGAVEWPGEIDNHCKVSGVPSD